MWPSDTVFPRMLRNAERRVPVSLRAAEPACCLHPRHHVHSTKSWPRRARAPSQRTDGAFKAGPARGALGAWHAGDGGGGRHRSLRHTPASRGTAGTGCTSVCGRGRPHKTRGRFARARCGRRGAAAWRAAARSARRANAAGAARPRRRRRPGSATRWPAWTRARACGCRRAAARGRSARCADPWRRSAEWRWTRARARPPGRRALVAARGGAQLQAAPGCWDMPGGRNQRACLGPARICT